MIESATAAGNLDAILAVDGLDAVLVGPYDLSASMGLTGQFDAPEFAEAIARILASTRRHGVACGIHIVTPDTRVLTTRIAEGYRFIAYAIDAVFLATAAVAPSTARSHGRG